MNRETMFPLLPQQTKYQQTCWRSELALIFCHFVFSISHCNSITSTSLHFLADLSILELYILVCMNRLEDKEQNSYNFNSIMKGIICSSPFTISPRQKKKKTDGCWTGFLSEYRSIQDAYKTSDNYAATVCFRVSMSIIKNYSYLTVFIFQKIRMLFCCRLLNISWTASWLPLQTPKGEMWLLNIGLSNFWYLLVSLHNPSS
jgi:hypothetical protein